MGEVGSRFSMGDGRGLSHDEHQMDRLLAVSISDVGSDLPVHVVCKPNESWLSRRSLGMFSHFFF